MTRRQKDGIWRVIVFLWLNIIATFQNSLLVHQTSLCNVRFVYEICLNFTQQPKIIITKWNRHSSFSQLALVAGMVV
jgi:hypothetical protein